MVQEVEVANIKYLSKDGKVYDTYEKAELADKEFDRKNSFDPTKEVAAFQKMCERKFSRIQKLIDAGKNPFPSFWLTENKYGHGYYMCNSFDDMEEMGWAAFDMWYDYYMCGTDQTVAVAELIRKTENKKASLAFVLDRCAEGYEYERMEEFRVTVFGDKNA